MNGLDIALLVLFIPGLVRGVRRGLLEQVISLAGIVAAVWLAYHFSAPACEWLRPHLTVSDTVLNVIGFGVVLVLAVIAVILLAKLFTKAVEMASLGWLNKSLGVVFGIGVTALILSILIILFDTLNAQFLFVRPEKLESSILYHPLRDLGYLVFPYLKQLLA